MGLFGFLGKAIGTVAKAGLSAVTHGVSDQVLGLVKGKPSKARAVALPVTAQNAAAILKSKPRVIRTETVMAGPPGGKTTNRTTKAPGARRKPKRRLVGLGGSNQPYEVATAAQAARLRKQGKLAKVIPRSRLTSPEGPAKKAKKRSGGGRKPPRGGLDLKKIAAEWRAQGKPGTWLDFIKSNPIRKAA